MENSLKPFFEPTGILVVGASQQKEKLGYGVARNLAQGGYPGAVHYVNVKGGELFGKQVHTRIDEVPDPVDLAVILIPPKFVPEAVRECGERGIRAAIIASGGFREAGEEGEKLENDVLQIANNYQVRLVGPNCIGMLNTHIPLDTTFLPPPLPKRGEIAFVSHSGALCAAVIDWAKGEGFGFSQLISLGNQLDVSEADVLEPLAEDENTRVITMYLEGVKDGEKFTREVVKASGKKPVIALKVGRFESGKKAASSHTGALAGAEEAFEAVFQRAGVLRATTTEEMFDSAKALAGCKLPAGERVGILTNAGGPGVTAADAVEAEGMSLAAFQETTRERLRAALPAAASVGNPVDMLASASPDDYAACLKILLDDEGVDSVVVIAPPPPMYKAEDVAEKMIPIIKNASKPVLVSLMGSELVEAGIEKLREAKIPEYGFPERAVGALGALSKRAEFVRKGNQNPIDVREIDAKLASEILGASRVGADGFLDEAAAVKLLEVYGMPALTLHLAQDGKEAVRLANEIGYPVAIKVSAKGISHKSDVGGVLVGLEDGEAVAQGYDQLMENLRLEAPGVKADGVYIQEIAKEGQEVIVGAVRDLQFGPLVMFGSGGVEVEGLGDVQIGLAPLTDGDVDRMLGETWAGKKLEGYRNIVPGDQQAVREALARLGQMMLDFPQILEAEINPLRVYPPGEGAAAIDIRVRVGGGVVGDV